MRSLRCCKEMGKEIRKDEMSIVSKLYCSRIAGLPFHPCPRNPDVDSNRLTCMKNILWCVWVKSLTRHIFLHRHRVLVKRLQHVHSETWRMFLTPKAGYACLTFPHDRRGATHGCSGWQSHAPLEGASTLCTGGTSCGSSAGRYSSETWHMDG